jgi:hypothetical protein
VEVLNSGDRKAVSTYSPTLPKATLGRWEFNQAATLTGLRSHDGAVPRVAEASTLGWRPTTASRLKKIDARFDRLPSLPQDQIDSPPKISSNFSTKLKPSAWFSLRRRNGLAAS